jgi:hypothetical protein
MSNTPKKVVRLTEDKMVDIIDKLATVEVEKRLAEMKRLGEVALIEGDIKTLQAKLKKLNESKRSS